MFRQFYFLCNIIKCFLKIFMGHGIFLVFNVGPGIFMGFCWKRLGFFWVLIFAPIWSSLSLRWNPVYPNWDRSQSDCVLWFWFSLCSPCVAFWWFFFSKLVCIVLTFWVVYFVRVCVCVCVHDYIYLFYLFIFLNITSCVYAPQNIFVFFPFFVPPID